MPLTLDQRLNRLRRRLGELEAWRAASRVAVEGWTCDGAPMAVGAAWPDRDGVRAFAASARAPEHWPLAEARLKLDLGGESLVTLRYPAGRTESFGLDPYHDEFPLLGPAFKIAAESVARLPFGQPVEAPALRRAELLRIEPDVASLHRLLLQVGEAVATLRADEVAPHLLDAGETALRGLRWPSLTSDYVARMASSAEMKTVWRLPPVDLNPPALDEDARASVREALGQLTARLAELKRRFPPRGRIALTGHAHIDLAWLWPYDETRRKLRRTFHTALSLMARSPDFHFNQSTAHYYAELEADDAPLFAAIKQRVAERRWEPIGGMWVEPDTNMPTGESLVRQLLYGQRYFLDRFGESSRVGWLPDCFGFSPALPQLFRQAGIDSFFTTKVNWSETNRFPHDLFYWQGLDGSRVLCHVFDNPLGGYNGMVQPDSFAPTWTNFRQKDRHDETLLAVGYGDGGGGVTPDMVAREVQLRNFPVLPEAQWGRVDAFFARAHEQARPLPTWRGEMYLELHRATLTTQSGVKRRHRRAERALITAETLAALAYCLGGAAPASLEILWRLVLKNEFHDILPGSSIREVYADAERELDGVIAAGAAAQQAALDAAVALWPKGGADDAVFVANPSLHPRLLEGELPGGGFISTAETVPALGFRVVRRAALAPRPGLSLKGRVLENVHLRAELGPDGALASLVHKATGREALDGRGNQLWVYPQDKPRRWDAWDVEEDYEASGEEIVALDALEVASDGPHYASLRARRRWRHSTIVQEIGLSAEGRRLDFKTRIDWRDRRALLRTLTPARVRASFGVAECAFGVIERPTHRNTSWETAAFEVAAHRFVDLSEPGFGLALLNDAKYGHSLRDNVLGLSLVRSPIYPDPLADEGEQAFAYALMPHAGAWHEAGVREEAEALNQPLLFAAAPGLAEGERRPLLVEGLGIGLAGLKRAEEGEGLVLRVYEPAGARGVVVVEPPEGWRLAGAVDLLERPVEAPPELRPFEVRSWRLERT